MATLGALHLSRCERRGMRRKQSHACDERADGTFGVSVVCAHVSRCGREDAECALRSTISLACMRNEITSESKKSRGLYNTRPSQGDSLEA